MPFKSKAQRRKFHAMEARGDNQEGHIRGMGEEDPETTP